MSLTQIINYDDENNFNFDSNKVEFSGGNAQLKISSNPGQTFSQTFANDTGFTYDSNAAEFTLGRVQQKDLRPNTDANFYASYDVNEDGTWGTGDLTGTLTNGTISGGRCVLTAAGAVIEYLNFSGADGNVGTIRLKYIPNYTGNPSNAVNIFTIKESNISNNSEITLRHDTASAWRSDIRSSTGTAILTNGGWGSSLLTAGVEYVIEFNWDFTGGLQQLYLDGVQQGGDRNFVNTTGTRGYLASGAGGRNHSIDDLIVFDAVQHTADHAGELPYTYSSTVYGTTTVECPAFVYGGVGSVQSFDSGAALENNAPRYIIRNAGQDYYWNGSSWAVSDGTFAQSMNEAAYAANIATYPFFDSSTIFKINFLASNVIGSAMEVDDLSLGYTAQAYDQTDPCVCFKTSILMDGLDGFSEVITTPANTFVQYTLRINDVDYYWSGAAWVTSDGSWAQSNTAAVIETNKVSFSALIASGASIKVRALLRTTDGLNTPLLTQNTINYNFYVAPPSELPQCIVYSFIEDITNGVPDFTAQNAILYVKNSKTFNIGDKLVIPFEFSTPYSTAGYTEISVIQTDTTSDKLEFRIEYTDLNNVAQVIQLKSVVIPAQTSANLATLVANA